MYSLNDYEMKLFGNNKVVCLVTTDPNPEYFNKGAIHREYKDDEGEGDIYTKLYLHLPEGRDIKANNFIIIR